MRERAARGTPTPLAAIEAAGPIDILINNAGIQRRSPLEAVEDEVWQEVIDVNLTAVFKVARAVARPMLERERGKIVNICSLMSEVGRPTVGPYTAAKGAVKMLTRAMCADWACRLFEKSKFSQWKPDCS